jgi:hypothetical protein
MLAAGAAALALALTGSGGAGIGVPIAAAAGPPALPATVSWGGLAHRIPRGFFGLSIEYNELKTYEASGVLFQRVISMLRPRDGGPLLLRIGGKSADHMLWDPNAPADAKPVAPGVFRLGYPWLSALSSWVHREHLRVILDLNLAVHSPTMAGAFVAAVRKALGPGRIAGLEIGNEPDMYHYQPRLTRERISSTSRSTPRHWWSNYSYANYRNDFVNYARTLKGKLPGIPLGAPDITRPISSWLTDLSGLGRLGPSFLAIHRYATSGCFAPGSSAYPTIPHLLNDGNAEGLSATVAPWVHYAHARGTALRITEINSVSCGKDRGVSDSFASALWAPDVLFSMIQTGVNGISWHIRPWPTNAPFHFRGDGILAMPELYGLAMFARMTHGPANLLSSSVSGSSGLHLHAWTVRRGPTVSVLLINKGGRAANVAVRAAAHAGSAYVRRLVAPRVSSIRGVRFAGQTIGSDGLWHGRERVSRAANRGGYYHLFVGAYSAALVTF